MSWKRWFGNGKALLPVADVLARFEDAAWGRLPDHELRGLAALAARFMDGTLILGSMDQAWSRVDPHQVREQPESLEAPALLGKRQSDARGIYTPLYATRRTADVVRHNL